MVQSISPPFRPHYPWLQGEELFADELNAAIANGPYLSSGGGYSLIYYGGKSDGVTDDAGALNTAIAAIIALPYGGKLIIPAGRTIIGSAIVASIPAGKTLTIEGMGPQASELYFSNATDGLSFTLRNSGALWGAVNLHSFTLTRGPTSPAMANTGIRITGDPAVAKQCGGAMSFRDLIVQGSGGAALTNQWTNGMVLDGISSYSVDNVGIYGVNSGATDLGDALLTINGPGNPHFSTSCYISNSMLQGGSAGLLITGYVQGVFLSNTTIIGQYDSVRWLSAASFFAEELALVNCSLNAGHRDFYTSHVNSISVFGTTMLRFGTGVAGGWAAVEINVGAFNSVIGNCVVGGNTGTENGIIVSASTTGANAIQGNTITNCTGAAVYLQGNTTGTTVIGNSSPDASPVVFQDTAGNTILGNTKGGIASALSTSLPVVFWSAASAVPRWFVGNDGATESGGDTGNDFEILRVHDNGSIIDGPFRISRATGAVTISRALFLSTATTGNFTNDAAAAAGGVPVGGVYRNVNVMMIRAV